MSFESILPIVVIIVALLVFIGAITNLRAVTRRREASASTLFPDALLIERANFFGQQSRGVRQMRGMGSLIITRSAVHFLQWMPQYHLDIPAQAITALDTTMQFLGKTQGVPLLRIDFENQNGQPDAAAWRVSDLDTVLRVVESIVPD